jgi:hypothetical protein
MPALSQNLTFQITNGNTTTTSVQVVYPNTATTALIYNSERIKGDGYFGGSDGVHTVLWNVSRFVGSIEIQGTLASAPGDSDWVTISLTEPGTGNRYTVDTTGLITANGIKTTQYTTETTASKSYNFTGNFVWIRGRISEFTEGVVNNISINR